MLVDMKHTFASWLIAATFSSFCAGSCPEQNGLDQGFVSCSNGNVVNSTCTFQCTSAGFSLFPLGVEQNICLPDNTWDLAAPCCARPCPPFAFLDICFLLDSSSSVGQENWEILKNFARSIMQQFTVASDSVRFSAFRYNRFVDRRSQILFDGYDNATDFFDKFSKIPYNGYGTLTGQALRHARDQIFQERNGDRPAAKNLLIVLTDGRAQDNVRVVAEELREQGVTTYGMGINGIRGQLNLQQLNDIAGDVSRMVVVSGGFGALIGLDDHVTGLICSDPCSRGSVP